MLKQRYCPTLEGLCVCVCVCVRAHVRVPEVLLLLLFLSSMSCILKIVFCSRQKTVSLFYGPVRNLLKAKVRCIRMTGLGYYTLKQWLVWPEK